MQHTDPEKDEHLSDKIFAYVFFGSILVLVGLLIAGIRF